MIAFFAWWVPLVAIGIGAPAALFVVIVTWYLVPESARQTLREADGPPFWERWLR